eukprot:315386_1
MSLKFISYSASPKYGSLQPLRYPIAMIPMDGDMQNNLTCVDKINTFKKYHITQANDVILSSYPKCGNHLLNKLCSEIMIQSDKNNVHEIYKNGDIGTATFPYLLHFISVYTEDEINKRNEWTANTLRFYWSHSQLKGIPFKALDKNTKIITMIRNPKDAIVSSYKYMNGAAKLLGVGQETESTIDDYISYFIRGFQTGGCYFDFYEKYWRAFKTGYCSEFGDINVLFLYYEDLIDENKKKETIVKTAMFLGKHENLNENDYDSIAQNIEFNKMKKELINNPQSFELGGDKHLRKGQSGDWQNYLNESQSYLIDETMYFKWAQYANDIKYYHKLYEQFSHCDKGYYSNKRN